VTRGCLISLHEESQETGNIHRQAFLAQFETWLDRQFEAAAARRAGFFLPDTSSPEAYAESLTPYRAKFRAMLGWPLTLAEYHTAPIVKTSYVGQDDLGRIERVWIEVFPDLALYGLLFLPRGAGRRPLVISQHGGSGTPELTAGFFGSTNYNDMTRRILRRGAVVFAPQLFRWAAQFGRRPDIVELDRQMRQLGGSIAAFEIYALRRALDALLAREEVDPDRVGMVGLSYGGFFTLFTAAADPRIQVALSSCFFNDRRQYGRRDWGYFNAANTFFDTEVAGLVCPRALYIEVAQNDELLDVAYARPHIPHVAALYASVGVPERFVYREHPGRHEFNREDPGLDFISEHLGLTRSSEACCVE
jgi:dienelactone hydrolase